MDEKKLIKNLIQKTSNSNIYWANVFKKKFKDLEKFTYIDSIKVLKNIKSGDNIKYVNQYKQLRHGGFFIKLTKEKDYYYLTLLNSYGKIFKINWNKNFIYHKKHKIKDDNLREIFLKAIS